MELMFWSFTALDLSEQVQPATSDKTNYNVQSKEQQKVLLKWLPSTFKPERN